MCRHARCAIVGYPHHVLQRGNYDQSVFESETDYPRYLAWLHEYSERYAVDIWAYCLMPNHVHFICVPNTQDGLARTFNTLHMRYAQYVNGKHLQSGHLWRARFMSCVLDNLSVREEVRFIENNPVRAHLVSRAEDYTWSSARGHISGQSDEILSESSLFIDDTPDWRSFLEGQGNEIIVRRARACLKTGRPAGDAAFVKKLEEIVGYRLGALSRGRPKKIYEG